MDLKWVFLPKQVPFMESTAPEVLYSGAFGGGKTLAICRKALTWGLTYPGVTIGIFRKTRTSLTHTTLKKFLEECPKGAIAYYNKTESHLVLTNGSEYIFGGLDDPIRWGSLELGFVFCDELIEFEEEDYNMLLGRLRQVLIKDANGTVRLLPFRQACAATNPGNPSHWLYKRAYVENHMQVIESNAFENVFNPESYRVVLRKFKGRYYERYVLGKWVSFEGAVFDNWSPIDHVIPKFDVPTEWRRIRSIDFGYVNPYVTQFIAIDPKDTAMYLYAEFYGSHRIVEDWAKDINDFSGNIQFEATLADWDAEDRATLERHGVTTREANKAVSPGIQSLYNRMSFADGGRPRLFLFENARINPADDFLVTAKKPTCTEEEIPGYEWEKTKEGKPVKESPVKVNDHGCLIAGTLVATEQGEIAIERVKPGDIVHTRHEGPRPVVSSKMTDVSASVFLVMFSNGKSLIGTKDHLVYVGAVGFIPLGDLKCGDIVEPIEGYNGDFVRVTMVLNLNQRLPVYNLAIDSKVGQYYANGILVHNCDALRYASLYVDGEAESAGEVVMADEVNYGSGEF